MGKGSLLTISPAYFSSSRASARVNPYSGSTQMVSNSAEPTSSYKYFERSSLWPRFVRLARTSAANSDTCRSGREEISMESPGVGLVSPRRNGMLRRRTDSGAGTSFGTTAEACTPLCAASRLSSRSACHRRNLQNSPGRRASAQILETAQTPSVSTPSRFRQDRARQKRSHPRDARQPETDPTIENQNSPCLCSEHLRPKGRGVPLGLRAPRRQLDEIAPPSAVFAQAISRRRSPRRGSRKQAIPAASGSRQTWCGTSTDCRRASKKSGARRSLFSSIPRLLRSTANDFRSRPLG